MCSTAPAISSASASRSGTASWTFLHISLERHPFRCIAQQGHAHPELSGCLGWRLSHFAGPRELHPAFHAQPAERKACKMQKSLIRQHPAEQGERVPAAPLDYSSRCKPPSQSTIVARPVRQRHGPPVEILDLFLRARPGDLYHSPRSINCQKIGSFGPWQVVQFRSYSQK